MAAVKVSQLNRYIKKVLSTDPVLLNVSVVGEVSNLRLPNANGHTYFSLKDEGASIRCFLPSWVAPSITCELRDGAEIIVNGSVDVYVPGGIYSLSVKSIDVKGEGDLAVRFEKLKRRLYKEGLFDEAHKKPIPPFPKKVAVITSGSGAAIKDITKTITEKNNVVDILIFPVAVQGKGSAEQIANAIDVVNRHVSDTDVIIVGRGGGSMEDLWSFNEEIVARAVYDSEIPVISGVGHEIDTTIIDYVADVSEKTPTAAAARAVPDVREIMTSLEQTREAMAGSLVRCADLKERRLEYFNMQAMLGRLSDRVDRASASCDNLKESMLRNFERKVSEGSESVLRCRGRLDGIENIISKKQSSAELLREKLINLDPHKIIGRGYGALLGEDGKMITGVGGLKEGRNVMIVMSDGDADATVDKIRRNEDG